MTDGAEEERLNTDLTPDAGYELNLDWNTLMSLLNASTSRCMYWQIADMIENVELTLDEVESIRKMPTTYRQRLTAAFLEYADAIREGLRSLDAQLLLLTEEV